MKRGSKTRLFQYDFKSGVVRAWPRCLLVAVIVLLSCLPKARFARDCVQSGFYAAPSLGNYIASWLKGIREVILTSDTNRARLPMEWLLLQFGYALLLSGYARMDYMKSKSLVMLRAGSRVKWWDGKCFWILCSTLLYYALFYVVLLALSIVSGISLDIVPHSEMWVSDVQWPGKWTFILFAFLLVPLEGFAAGMVQVLLELVCSQMVALIAACGFSFAALYWHSPLLIGNYTMLSRIGDNVFSVPCGICVCIVFIVIAYVAGRVYIRKRDD